MQSKRVVAAAVLTVLVLTLPATEASARHHGWFPLFLPFAAAAAVVGTAATIATAPIAAVTAPAYYPPYYGSPYPAPGYGPGYGYAPPPPPPAYYGYPGYYGPR